MTTSMTPTDTLSPAEQVKRMADELRAICDMQEAFYGDGITTHLRLSRRCRSARAALSSFNIPEIVVALDTSPWNSFHGDLPDYDHPFRCVFESGVQYAVELLAKTLRVEHWEICDGTEEFDGDLAGTLFNIVLGAMPKDNNGDPMHPDEIVAALEGVSAYYDETAWVIEHGASEPCNPRYWGGVHGWTREHMKAVRFSREVDAQSVAESMDDGVPGNYRLCEHMWMNALRPQPSPDTPSQNNDKDVDAVSLNTTGATSALSDEDQESLYDKIHMEELAKGGRMGAIRLRVVRRFNEELR